MTFLGGNRSVTIALAVNAGGVRAGLAIAKRELSDFARAGIDANAKQRRAMEDLGAGMAGFGLAVGLAAGVAVKSFANFDKAMSRVGAATQATTSQMSQLREAALKAGADTQYSATQAADAITELSKAGVSTKDILAGGLQSSLNLAAAGELEVARAAEIAATTMTQFGLSGADAGRIADVLAAGAGEAQGSVEDLAQGLKYVGPLASSMGISLEQTVGVLAEFASKGIIGEQAGTSLRGMLSSLRNPSEKAAETMKALGISIYDTQGNFIGLDGVAARLGGALNGLSKEQQNVALGTIFGNEQLTAATVLYEGGARAVKEWQDRVTDAGRASRQAGQLMDNLSGDVEQLQGSLETAFISSGAGANEGLRTLTQGATGAVNAFGALPDPLQRSTVVAAGLTASVALLGGGMLLLAAKTRDAKETLSDLGVSGTKASRGLKAVGAGIAAISIGQALPGLSQEFDQYTGVVTKGGGELEESLIHLAKTGELSGEALNKFGKDFEGTGNAFNKYSAGFFTTGEGLRDTIDRLSQSSDNVFEKFLHWGDSTQSQAQNLKAVGDALGNMVASGNSSDAQAVFRQFAEGAGLSGKETEKLLDLMPGYRDALQQVKNQAKDTTGAITDYALGQHNASVASANLAAAQEELSGALDASRNRFLEGRDASRGYQEAIDAASESAKENGRTLDESTEKGRSNAEALDNLAGSALTYLDSLRGENGEVTPKFTASLGQMRASLVTAGQRFGLTKKQAGEYADKILEIPTRASTEIVLAGVDAAIAKMRALAEQRRRLLLSPGESTLPKFLTPNPANGADGMIIPHMYADGGMENHVAQIARPKSTVRIWAEPETGGEAYIPLAPSKRQRSKAILKQTANIFGMQAFAAGGFSDPYGASDVQQRYEGMLPKPITGSQYAAAIKARETAEDRRRRAAISVDNAERDLARTRRKSPKDAEAIRDAEDRLNKARISYAAARRNEAAAEAKARDAVRRKNAPKGFNLGLYANALGQTVRQAEAYRRNLAAVEKRGGAGLAGALEAMGADGAPLIAALVKASPAQFKRIAALLRRLDPDAFGAGQKVTRFASGGIAPATMGGWRVIAEAGMDEAYIPLGQRNIARSRMLTDTTASRLGGRVQWSSHRVSPVSGAPVDGGGSTGRSYGSLLHADKVEVIRGGPTEVADEVMFRVRQLGG
jgi:TP901 family phage tail tape measure protein